jgi:hypothetical protein
MAKNRTDAQGWLVFALGGLFLAAMGGFYLYSSSKPKPNADGCFSQVNTSTVILLDHSEHVSTQTAAEMKDRVLNHIKTNVVPGDLVSVYSVSNLSRSNLTPLFKRCKPKEDGNRLTEGVAKIQKDYLQKFEKPLINAIERKFEETAESPIAQALTDISLSKSLRSEKNFLIVYSDMLENTAGFSMYSCQDPTGGIDKFRDSRRGTKERPTFKNTMVSIHLIPREGQSKTTIACRDRFWMWFFGDNEGENSGLNLDMLPGGAKLVSK